ncbi:MAG: hydantoinase B/oxoprolinase family protein, partial [Actinomycetota bacterium]
IRRDYRRLAAEADGISYLEQTAPRCGPRARDGGGPGRPGRAALRDGETGAERPLPGKGYLRIRRGDTLILEGAGGGGYGDPAAP